MQRTGTRRAPQTRWTHGRALERQFGLPRGMLLTHAAHGESVVKRVLSAARLDGALIDQLAGMLTITVREWLSR